MYCSLSVPEDENVLVSQILNQPLPFPETHRHAFKVMVGHLPIKFRAVPLTLRVGREKETEKENTPLAAYLAIQEDGIEVVH